MLHYTLRLSEWECDTAYDASVDNLYLCADEKNRFRWIYGL